MAFSAQNDASQNSGREDNSSTHAQSSDNQDERGKVFTPNPEAKPFYPGLQLDLHLDDRITWGPEISSHNGVQHQEMSQSPNLPRMMLGQVPDLSQPNELENLNCSFFHSSPSSESDTTQLLIPVSKHDGKEQSQNGDGFVDISQSKSSKEHIAYHLLATVLGDEITEDTRQTDLSYFGKDLVSDISEKNDSWPASVSSISSSLSLTLDLGEQGMQHHTNFSNRSIHDIWSPNISPKESSQSSPSEDAYTFFPSDNGHDSPFHSSGRDFMETSTNKTIGLSSPTSVPLSRAEQYLVHIRSPTQTQTGQGYSSSFPPTNNNYISSSPDNLVEKYTRRIGENGYCAASYSSQLSYFSEDRTSKTASDYEDLSDPFLPFEDTDTLNRGKQHSVHFEDKVEDLPNTTEQENVEINFGKDESTNAAKLLGLTLDECLDQLRSLEKECRKAEHQLAKIYPSRRGSSSCSTNHLTKLPTNPTRVDKMILEQSKEHGKVESLVGRIERLGTSPLHPNVGIALDKWLACIRELQNIRREEISTSGAITNGHYPKKSYSDKDLFNLAKCMRQLISHTRAARTTVWCAVQMLNADSEHVKLADHGFSTENQSDLLSVRS